MCQNNDKNDDNRQNWRVSPPHDGPTWGPRHPFAVLGVLLGRRLARV